MVFKMNLIYKILVNMLIKMELPEDDPITVETCRINNKV
jgi:hypothetical protein